MAPRFLNFLRSKTREPENSTAAEVETVERRAGQRWEALGQAGLVWVDAGGELHSVEVALMDRSADGLLIVSPIEFAVGDELFVALSNVEQVKAAVRHRGESQDGWHVGLRLLRRDRRRRQRLPSRGSAVLHWLGSDCEFHKATVEVRNIATDGMQLSTPERVPVGTAVKLTGESMECIGVTSYCRPGQEGYTVGIQMSRHPYEKNSLDFDD